MKQQHFIDNNEALWKRLAERLDALELPPRKRGEAVLHDIPELYRQVCAHYALARHRHYSASVVDHLHDLVLRGHAALYRKSGLWLWRALYYLRFTVPATVREQAAVFWLGTALFWLPALVAGLVCYLWPDAIYTLMDQSQVAEFEWMYNPDNNALGRSEARASDTNIMMFGFYIWNNVGIGFRTFASGMFLGLGTVFILLFNGVYIGATAGYLSQLGYIDTFWGFVCGHSAFELTAICISGAAGLLLGKGILMPGRRSRTESLKRAAQQAVPMVVVAMLLLFGAAFIEAFWSSNRAIPLGIKYGVSLLLWALLVAYLWRGGRRHRHGI